MLISTSLALGVIQLMGNKEVKKITQTRAGFRLPLHCSHTLRTETRFKPQWKQIPPLVGVLLVKQNDGRKDQVFSYQGRRCQRRTNIEFEQDKSFLSGNVIHVFFFCFPREPGLSSLEKNPDFLCNFPLVYVVLDHWQGVVSPNFMSLVRSPFQKQIRMSQHLLIM